jgi:hypothetical protein
MGIEFLKTSQTIKEEKPKDNSMDKENNTEKEKPIGFYITDHSADLKYGYDKERLKELYGKIKKNGVDSIRYDWRWKEINPKEGEINERQLDNYQEARDAMEEVGLHAPTIILSDVPEWAQKLYDKGEKDDFFSAFRTYAESVKDKLQMSGGQKLSRIQILNELNNSVYTKVKTDDMPELCRITREVFKEYNEDIQLMATLSVNNLQDLPAKVGFGKGIKEYMAEFKKIKDNFDIVALDYYPGLWHWPIKDAKWKPKDVFKQMGLLKEVMEEVESWDKDYELGEVGLPTNKPWSNEKRQRYFYDTFFRTFKQLMIDFKEQGKKLPARIGLYEAIDEEPANATGKFLRKATPFPEHDMGLRDSSGSDKMILRGKRGKSWRNGRPLEAGEMSQLERIIKYVNADMKKVKNDE